MNVGIVTHNVLKGDGQGRVNYELAKILKAKGIDVELFADRVDESLLDEGIKWTPINPGFEALNLAKVWRFAKMADTVLSRRRNQRQALLACGFTTTYPHALNVAHFVHGIWLKSSFHSSRVRRGLNPVYQRVYSSMNARWEKQAFAQAQTVVALSEMVRRELIEVGVAENKIETIVNGVDLDEFRPGQSKRDMVGFPKDVRVGLFVGDLKSPIKNLDLVLQGLKEISSLHLAVVGEENGSVYPGLAQQFGLEKRVHFLGYRRDIAEIMRAADFFVLPSRRDSCPLVLLEAMASGLPIITSTTVGTSNLVTDHMGMVVDGPDDLAGMKAALLKMTADSDALLRMGEASRRTAEEYSWECMADRYIALFQRYTA